MPVPCIQQGCFQYSTEKGRCEEHQLPAFYTTDRKAHLPSDWRYRSAYIISKYKGICHVCGEPGSDATDHIIPNDDHSESNLRPIHQYVRNSQGRLCHFDKTSQEGNEAKKGFKNRQQGQSIVEEYYRRQRENDK